MPRFLIFGGEKERESSHRFEISKRFVASLVIVVVVPVFLTLSSHRPL